MKLKEFEISNNNLGNNVSLEMIKLISENTKIDKLCMANIEIDDKIHIDLF